MDLDTKTFMRTLSPKVMAKAVQAFDRAMTVVVGVCWGAAILMMGFAVYTTMMSLSSKRAADAAVVAEPILPKIVRKTIEPRNAQAMIERLQHRYPDISFAIQNNNSLTVTAVEGSKFHQWLTALSYIDTISPEYHWSIQQFCVGKCRNGDLMRAVLSGEKISFEAPQPN